VHEIKRERGRCLLKPSLPSPKRTVQEHSHSDCSFPPTAEVTAVGRLILVYGWTKAWGRRTKGKFFPQHGLPSEFQNVLCKDIRRLTLPSDGHIFRTYKPCSPFTTLNRANRRPLNFVTTTSTLAPPGFLSPPLRRHGLEESRYA
jgi:hypothetical protein